MNRRSFLTLMGGLGIGSALGGAKSASAAGGTFHGYPDSKGVLHDTTLCIGCAGANRPATRSYDLPKPEKPFTDLNVLNEKRRTSAKEWTVVKQVPSREPRQGRVPQEPVHALRGTRLRQCVLREGVYQEPRRFRDLRSHPLRGLPLLHGRVPVQYPGYTYDRALNPLVQIVQRCATPACRKASFPAAWKPAPPARWCSASARIWSRSRGIASPLIPNATRTMCTASTKMGGTAWMTISGAEFKESGPQRGSRHQGRRRIYGWSARSRAHGCGHLACPAWRRVRDHQA